MQFAHADDIVAAERRLAIEPQRILRSRCRDGDVAAETAVGARIVDIPDELLRDDADGDRRRDRSAAPPCA